LKQFFYNKNGLNEEFGKKMGKEVREETENGLRYESLREKEKEGRKKKGKGEDKERWKGIRKERRKRA
jgi:hypothetical protein